MAFFLFQLRHLNKPNRVFIHQSNKFRKRNVDPNQPEMGILQSKSFPKYLSYGGNLTKKNKNWLNEGAEFEENNVAVDSLPEL